MIPLSDSPRTLRTPWVNLSLIAGNILIFLYELSLGQRIDPFLARWGVVPDRISGVLAGTAPFDPLVLVTLVTAAFLHGGWLHLGGNMLFLWIFGDNVEDRLGHWSYLGFYLSCGIVANLAQVASDPTSTEAAIGASGAIAGVLGAYAVTFPGARVSVIFPILFFWIIDVPALIMIGVWFATQFFSGVASLSQASTVAGDIAWWAHVGGFVFGIAAMLLLPKNPVLPAANGSTSRVRRARDDTGLVGLATGTVSMISQVAQVALAVRVIAEFVGLRTLGQFVQILSVVIRWTGILARPLDAVVPRVAFAGHLVDVGAIAAIFVVYLIGRVIIWAIAILVDGSNRRDARLNRRLDYDDYSTR